MTLEQLIELVPPPSNPVAVGRSDIWPAVEAALGSTLPKDYKEIVNTYGAFSFRGFFGVVSPFDLGTDFTNNNQLFLWIKTQLETYKDSKKMFPKECPYSSFPEFGGLLPFAGDDNGGVTFWLTEGEPDEWTIVVGSEDFSEYEHFETNLIGFLIQLATNKIKPVSFPSF